MMTNHRLLSVIIFICLLASCAPQPVTLPTVIPSALPTVAPAPIEQPLPTPTESPSLPVVEPTLPALPPEPQRIEFVTEDNVPLVGYYYPAAVNPAPVVVLMHWAEGDQTDWLDVGMVTWLQNRGTNLQEREVQKTFDTPFPFKMMDSNRSFAVFTFDFRGYGESGFGGDWSKYILDAKAAYRTAASLEGVDPDQVIGIGASIGADAVVDACENCLAALSLSPGDYLGVPYADAVGQMEKAGKTTMCVAAETDMTAYYRCKDLSGEHFVKQIYPSGGHAMRLFRQELNLDPPVDDILYQFLDAVVSW